MSWEFVGFVGVLVTAGLLVAYEEYWAPVDLEEDDGYAAVRVKGLLPHGSCEGWTQIVYDGETDNAPHIVLPPGQLPNFVSNVLNDAAYNETVVFHFGGERPECLRFNQRVADAATIFTKNGTSETFQTNPAATQEASA